jgi:hypothetical protein
MPIEDRRRRRTRLAVLAAVVALLTVAGVQLVNALTNQPAHCDLMARGSTRPCSIPANP